MVGHVKAGTATHGYISFRGNNSNNYAYAQIEFASPGSVSTGGVGFTSISGTVTALGSSWYRLTLTATTGSNVSGAFAFLGVNDGTAFGISGYPVWSTAGETLDVWGAQISSTNTKVYDSPTTTQISRSYAPSLKYVTPATGGMARFEYDPADGQSAGILIESQSTNLISYSDDTTNSWWFKSESTATGDLVPNATTNANHYLQKTGIATTVSTTYTYSLYVKSAGVTKFAILMFQNTSPFTQFGFASVDLGAGTINGTIGSGATIQAASNGWYRVSVSGAALTTVSNPRLWFQDSAGNFNHTPNGYDGLLVAGQQFEANSFPSSLVSTSGANATRAADSLSVVSSSLFDNGEGALFVENKQPNATQNNAVASITTQLQASLTVVHQTTSAFVAISETSEVRSTTMQPFKLTCSVEPMTPTFTSSALRLETTTSAST
jgi:hypothetical protein